jgi:hypothetical protein
VLYHHRHFLLSDLGAHSPGFSGHVPLNGVHRLPPILPLQATAMWVFGARCVAHTRQEPPSLEPRVKATACLLGLGRWWWVVLAVVCYRGVPGYGACLYAPTPALVTVVSL